MRPFPFFFGRRPQTSSKPLVLFLRPTAFPGCRHRCVTSAGSSIHTKQRHVRGSLFLQTEAVRWSCTSLDEQLHSVPCPASLQSKRWSNFTQEAVHLLNIYSKKSSIKPIIGLSKSFENKYLFLLFSLSASSIKVRSSVVSHIDLL